jgi:biopolymer transport protein ExbD
MDLDRTIRLNDQPITMDKLEATLTEVYRRRAVKNLFIRGASDLPYGDVFVLLDVAKRSGVADIALLEQRKKPEVAPATARASR